MIKKRLMDLLTHSKKYIVCQVLWQWFALLCQIVMIYAACMLLNYGFNGMLSPDVFRHYGFMVLIALFLRFFCDRQATYASHKASIDVKRILREKIYTKLLRLGASYAEQISTAQVVQMSGEGVEQLETYFGRYLPQLFYSVLAPVTLFAVLSFFNFKASLVLLICVPLIPISIVVVQKIAAKLFRKYWGVYTELGDSFLENLQGLTTLKIYQADEKKAEEMDEESQRFRRITMKVLTMQLNSTSVMDIIAYGGAAVGMIVVLQEFAAMHVGLVGTLMIILLASEFFIPLRLLGSFFHIAMNGMSASDKIFAFLDLPEDGQGVKELDLYRTEQVAGDGSKGSETGNIGGIVLSNLSFSYEANREILKDISMEFPRGSFTSMVGTSGCGKSTIAGILMGRNRGYSGEVSIGGVELSRIREDSLMKNITLVSHNSYLFKGTVKENLLMGDPMADEKRLIQVLEQVNLWGFLKEQQGLDTPVLEQGGNFSGGQCQRLAMARALLHDTPVYIFDEATSNIDVESEEMIMELIHQLAVSKTVILISHRLANVVKSNRIYMLQKGAVVQSGTHEELMKQGGVYRELYEHQQTLEMYSREVAQC